MSIHDLFRRGAHTVSQAIGSPYAFALAVAAIVAWALAGPYFNYSEDWQLVINTGTTIVTFLVVFIVQNTQNRDSKALHLKLDEVIRAVDHARTRLVELENWTDEELKPLEREFEQLGGKPRRHRHRKPSQARHER
jgi:low affinity Fe/Cu permease